MNQDGFVMNVKTNFENKQNLKKSGLTKKQEKKNKYTEKKLLNKKRERSVKENLNKNSNQENSQNNSNPENKKPQNKQRIKKNFLDFNENNENVSTFAEENIKNEEKIPKKIEEKNQKKIESLDLNENQNFQKENATNNFEKENFGIKKSNRNQDGEEIIDELNEFYEKKDKLNEGNQKRLSSDDRQKNKIKIKTMQNEINKEFEEINKTSELQLQKKEEKNKEIDYKSSVFSIKDFQDLEISPYLKKVLQKENLSIMTKVQKKSIPILLKHRDVVVKSETGSGKTLAYLIPVLDFLISQNIKQKISRKDGVYVLVFAPTHELCLQIEATFDTLKSSCISAVFGSLMGGQSIETEKSRLRKGLNVIITTPGRLLYHLNNTTTINFTTLKMLIFDEADILLNMGFEKDIKECMRQIHNKFNGYSQDMVTKMTDDDENRNLIVDKIENLNSENFKKFKIFLISATIDYKIRKMADFLMKGFKSVGFEMKNNKDKNKENTGEIDEEENETFSAPVNLTQEYSIVFDEFRLIHLICQIFNNVNKKLIVFVNNCDTVNFLQEFLEMFEFNTEHIIDKGEVGVGFNKYKDRANIKDNNRSKSKPKAIANNEFGNEGKDKNNKETQKSSTGSTKGKLIKLINTSILKLHGKMKHEERKRIFNRFNEDKPAVLICTDVASRGLDFPHVDLIIHYDVNPDPKEYLNRMGRTARLDKQGDSLLFLMKQEEKILSNSLRKFTINNSKAGKILLNFVENLNKLLTDIECKQRITTVPQAYKDEVDENEKYRKKYIFAIFPLQKSIKDYLFKDRENLNLARKAFKSSIRSYVVNHKWQKDVFNVKCLNLTRYARSFCLYKESSNIKVGGKSVIVDYEAEKKTTKGNKKFSSKKIEKRLMISEFN